MSASKHVPVYMSARRLKCSCEKVIVIDDEEAKDLTKSRAQYLLLDRHAAHVEQVSETGR